MYILNSNATVACHTMKFHSRRHKCQKSIHTALFNKTWITEPIFANLLTFGSKCQPFESSLLRTTSLSLPGTNGQEKHEGSWFNEIEKLNQISHTLSHSAHNANCFQILIFRIILSTLGDTSCLKQYKGSLITDY